MTGRGWPVPPSWLRQPDRRSCGAAVLVAARTLAHPTYAAALASPAHARAEILRVHAEATGAARPSGGMQVPWPRALGTPPWAVAARLSALAGVPYRQHLIRVGDGFDRLAAAGAERPAALYVGSALLPRHVVLVTSADQDGVRCFEPARGVIVYLSRDRFEEDRLDVAGWSHPWFAVVPRVASS